MGLPPANTEKGRFRGAALLTLFALLIAGPPALPAIAAETDIFGLQPQPLEVDGQRRRGFRLAVPEGGAVRDAVLLFNKTDETLRMRIYGADAQQGGGVSHFGAELTGVGRWISPEVGSLELGPKERRAIEFSVVRPEDEPPGLGAIVAEQVPEDDPDSAISVRFRVALQIAVSDTSEGPHVALEGARLDVPLRLIPSDGEVRVRVVNATATPLRTQLRTTVRSLTGRRYDLRVVDVDVPAGGEAEYAVPWANVPRWGGFMRAEVEADWEAGTAFATTPRKVVVPIWLLLLLYAGVGFIWWRVRKRSPPDPD